MRTPEILLRAGTAALFVGIMTFSGACKEDQSPTLDHQPGISRILTPDSSKVKWEKLPSIEQIKRLELKQFPDFADFSLNNALSIATAQFFCQQTKCHNSPEDMAKSVTFVNEVEFLQVSEKNRGRPLTEEDKIRIKNRIGVTFNHENIYINETHLARVVKDMSINQSGLMGNEGKDAETILKKSALIHEFTHLNMDNKRHNFEQFSFPFEILPPVRFESVKNFQIYGKMEKYGSFVILGSEEAIAEKAATIIGLKLGTYLSTPNYMTGVTLLGKINMHSNITDEEFLAYVNGNLPTEELFRRWGKNNIQTGINALALIGLEIDGLINPPETTSYLQKLGLDIQ